MANVDAHWATWLLAAIQATGLLSAWLARLSEGSRGQTLCQYIFLTCLAVVGGAALLALTMGAASWLFCGFTLSLMILAAVWDFRGSLALEAT